MEPNEWLIHRLAADGYDCMSLPTARGYITSVMDPDTLEHIQKYIDDNLSKRKTVEIFWQISSELKRKERKWTESGLRQKSTV